MSNPEYPSYHVRNELYVSHFLSTWNSRLFEFGAVLFISTIFPGTLFPASIYALTRSASVVVFSTAIGHLIDRSERIFLIRLSISKVVSLVNIIFHLFVVFICIKPVLLAPLSFLDLDQYR
jgi:lipoprotein signal peptidase